MNTEESRFRDLLNEPPFDASYRSEHRDQLRQQLLETFDASLSDQPGRASRLAFPNWRELMRRPLPRIAAVLLLTAVVLAAFTVVSRMQPTIAFAKLIEPILNAKTARFNTVVEGKDVPKQTIRTLIVEPNHVRQEMPLGQIQISDFNVGKMMVLTPDSKRAMVFNMTDMPAQQKPANFFDTLRTNLRDSDRDIPANRKPLGHKQIDGHEAIGFQVKQPQGEMMIWGDAKTGLPIVVEMEVAMFPGMKVTMTDFEFDVDLDEALFRTDPPEGYSVQKINLTTPSEKDLITTLKLLSESNEGRFPDTFDNSAIVSAATQAAQKQGGQADAVSQDKMMDRMLPLTQGLTFAATLPPDTNARYAGKGVQFGDAASPVFWYKPAGAASYRVILGDLSIKEQSEAPQSPQATTVTLGTSRQDMMRELNKAKGSRPLMPAPPRQPPAEAVDPAAPKPQPNDPAAQQLLDRMAKVYADCKSYQDSGVVITRLTLTTGEGAIKTSTTEKPFTTAFVRPDRFRFEFKDTDSLVAGQPARYIIWSNGKEVQTWWDLKPTIEKPDSLGLALGAATGVSGSSAATIPAMLLGQAWGNLKGITDAQPPEVDQLDKLECLRVAGKFGPQPITVWIDTTSHLVRRVDTQMKLDQGRVEQTTTYDPTIDVEVPDKSLEFDPPAAR